MKESTPSEGTIERAEKEICRGLYVKYTLTEDPLEGRCAYSVKAEIRDTGETSVARDITSDRDKAKLMFEMISEGAVTPCCLAEIAEDLIEAMLEDTPQEKNCPKIL